MTARKVRLVVDMIRGMDALYASEALQFVNKAAAVPVKKALDSAIANATNNYEMDKKLLKVVEARVDEAPTFKRGRAVSKGRYHQILKRNSHIVIAVSDGSEEKSPPKVKKLEKTVDKVKKVSFEKAGKSESKKKKSGDLVKDKAEKKTQIEKANTPRRVQAKG